MPEPLREIDRNPMHYFELGYIPMGDYLADLTRKKREEESRVLSTLVRQNML